MCDELRDGLQIQNLVRTAPPATALRDENALLTSENDAVTGAKTFGGIDVKQKECPDTDDTSERAERGRK